MTTYTDRIKPTDYGIHTYLESLRKQEYQIPTFQRNVVWEKDNVKKLWDSIFRFYPLGSILIWKTELKLQEHREIGGHIISESNDRTEYQYILDGQQRTTSLLTSLYGGKIEGKPNFDPTLYFDLTIEDEDEIDDESFRRRFLFWTGIDDKDGSLLQNKGKMKRFNEGLIVKLSDVKHNFGEIERILQEGDYSDYYHPYRQRLRDIRDVLDNYRVSFIELKGIDVSQVCQIFERINQAGKPLSIFDIVVAKTFRTESDDRDGFYLRQLIEDFRNDIDGNFKQLDDLSYLQVISVLINQNIQDSKIHNITDRYLNDIKASQIEEVWDVSKEAFKNTFDFFENHLHFKGPQLIPFRYFYMTIVNYFFKNPSPNIDFLKKYFWFYSFHNEDLLSNTTHLWNHIEFLTKQKNGENPTFDRFLIDKNRLRTSSYSSRGRLSRAILCLFSNHEPRDWSLTDRKVLSDVYYFLTDKPNLHHIFPLGYIGKNPGQNKIDANSLMNIAYLTQITNLKISDKNPIDYLKNYDVNGFEDVLNTHLIPTEILEWSRKDKMPKNASDQFIELRIDNILSELKKKLSGINIEVVDLKEGNEAL
jgi:hypothetical protein|tara:strand:- start:195 stop:1961 length:1767 start_codon:yes stop_codon:yes gene_type:complete